MPRANRTNRYQQLVKKIFFDRYAKGDEMVPFITTYSLQNHLRTTVSDIGQIEIDEIYVGVDHKGRQYVMPVQAKAGNDQIGVVQTNQDIRCCAEKYPSLICRPIATQFMRDDVIAIFELCLEEDEIRIVEERHYLLTPATDITPEDLQNYRLR